MVTPTCVVPDYTPAFLPAQSPLYPVSISCFSRDRAPLGLRKRHRVEGARNLVIPGTLSEAEREKTTASPYPAAFPRNRSNTSFDSSLPRGVSRANLPSRAMSPSATISSTTDAAVSRLPNSSVTDSRSIPRVSRKPRKNDSSNASCRNTTTRLMSPPLEYSSRESAVENLTASPPSDQSMECASTPNPRYGCRVQYFRLCRDSSPARAKLEISY